MRRIPSSLLLHGAKGPHIARQRCLLCRAPQQTMSRPSLGLMRMAALDTSPPSHSPCENSPSWHLLTSTGFAMLHDTLLETGNRLSL